jgi:signal transduction histidine kinase
MNDPRGKVQEAIELQRGAIAAEIHDSLLPYIFAARMRLETLLARIEQTDSQTTSASFDTNAQSVKTQTSVDPLAPRDLNAAVQLLQDAMMVGRELISQLYPADMTISWQDHLTNSFERLTAHDASQLIVEGDLEEWVHDPDQRLAARRIAQEAIRNAFRHGKAAKIEVVTQHNASDVQVSIRDNGIGFDPTAGYRGFGLRIMQMRAAQVDAAISIESQRGGPTAITLTISDQVAAVAD